MNHWNISATDSCLHSPYCWISTSLWSQKNRFIDNIGSIEEETKDKKSRYVWGYLSLPLYPSTATAMVSRAHRTYSKAMAALRAQSFLHLVHSLPSWIPTTKTTPIQTHSRTASLVAFCHSYLKWNFSYQWSKQHITKCTWQGQCGNCITLN